MTTSILADAFGHHVWATKRVLDACANLTSEQLAAPSPGTYGPIIDTLRHIVQADSYYLSIFTDKRVALLDEDNKLSIGEMKALMDTYSDKYGVLLARDLDPDEDVRSDGGAFSAKMGIRLAQVVHHGSDHRSQVCTALTGLGLTPPDIDLWAYGDAMGRTRDIETAGA